MFGVRHRQKGRAVRAVRDGLGEEGNGSLRHRLVFAIGNDVPAVAVVRPNQFIGTLAGQEFAAAAEAYPATLVVADMRGAVLAALP